MIYKVIDLFAGAGGLSSGFCQTSRFDIVAAFEFNKQIQSTYRRNHPGTDIFNDVRNVDFEDLNEKYGGIDVVVGGPPCQGFSNANRQRNHLINSNNQLVKEYIRAIIEIKPKIFVLENVKMLSSQKHKFYYSYQDKETIDSVNLKMEDEFLSIELPEQYREFVLSDIRKQKDFSDYVAEKNAFAKLNVLYKKIISSADFQETLERNEKENYHAAIREFFRYSDMKNDDYSTLMRKLLGEIAPFSYL